MPCLARLMNESRQMQMIHEHARSRGVRRRISPWLDYEGRYRRIAERERNRCVDISDHGYPMTTSQSRIKQQQQHPR